MKERNRERDLEHLKLMVDLYRHAAVLSAAALLLTINLSVKLFDSPSHTLFALASTVGFLVCLVAAFLAQVGHIDRVKEDQIYEYPLPNKFAIPVLLCVSGFLVGFITLSAFIMLNWFGS